MRKLLFVAASAALLAGCGTITRGTSQDWSVITDPIGASVTTTNGFHCDATPCTFHMPRTSQFVATVTRPGYQTVQAQIDHRVGEGGAATVAGNVLAGGIIGMGVDAATGANQDIRPNPLILRLETGAGTIVLNWADAERVSNANAPAAPSR